MRHRISGKQLCLKSNHRRAMLRNLAAGLFEHGQIETTLPKAKAVQRYVEKLITMAKTKNLANRRQITSKLTDRKVFAWVADPNVKESRKTSPFWSLPEQGEIEFNRYGEVRKAPRLIEHIFKKARGLPMDGHHYFQEIIVNSDNLVHIFLRGKTNESLVACFVCRRSTNLGMALTKARMSMPELETSL